MEAEASDLLIVTIDLIPAHFQTERYMQALFEGNGEGLPQTEIDRLKRVRLDRLSWERKRVAALSLPASRALILRVADDFLPGTG